MNVIIIPYRNRKSHLDYFLTHSVPLLTEHLEDTKVVVVEQTEGTLFNRGKLLNIDFIGDCNKTVDLLHTLTQNIIIHMMLILIHMRKQ